MSLHVVMAIGTSEIVDISVVNKGPIPVWWGREQIHKYAYEVRKGAESKRGEVVHQRSKGALVLLQQVLHAYDSEWVDDQISDAQQQADYDREAHE